MNDIILVGGFHEMIEFCEDAGYNIIGIIDNNLVENYLGYPILGTDSDASAIYNRYPCSSLVIVPDEPLIREKLVNLYRSVGFTFATLIHPSATISRFATIGEGTIVQRGVNVSANTKIGGFCKLNTNSNVMHDSTIADFVTIAPSAVLLGHVAVGDFAYIGANSTVLPHCSIGECTTVGAGAVVTKNIPSNSVVVGVPAGNLKK